MVFNNYIFINGYVKTLSILVYLYRLLSPCLPRLSEINEYARSKPLLFFQWLTMRTRCSRWFLKTVLEMVNNYKLNQKLNFTGVSGILWCIDIKRPKKKIPGRASYTTLLQVLHCRASRGVDFKTHSGSIRWGKPGQKYIYARRFAY